MLVEIFDAIPDLVNTALMAGYIIDVYSDSVRVHEGSGYLSFEEILEYKSF